MNEDTSLCGWKDLSTHPFCLPLVKGEGEKKKLLYDKPPSVSDNYNDCYDSA